MEALFPQGFIKYRLRRNSPIRAWLEGREAAPHLASAGALLGALADPAAAGWADRAAAYKALSEIPLSPEEGAQARLLLSQDCARPPLKQMLMARLGRAALLAPLSSFPITLCYGNYFLEHPTHSGNCMTEGLEVLAIPCVGFLAFAAMVPLVLGVLLLLDYLHQRVVRRAAVAALARIDKEASAPSGPASEYHSHWTPSTQQEAPHGSDFRAKIQDGALEGRLPRRSPIRAWLAAQRSNTDSAPAASLLQALASIRPDAVEERAIAYHALTAFPLSEPERMHASRLLSHSLQRRSANSRLFRLLGQTAAHSFLAALPIAGTLTLLLAVQIGLVRAAATGILVDMKELLWMLGLFGFLAGLLTVLAAPFLFVMDYRQHRAPIEAQRAAIAALTHIGGPECLVALAAHLPPNASLHQEALRAAHAILPRISESCYGQLPSRVEQTLLALMESPGVELALAALDALGRAGSGNSAPGVEKLIATTRFPAIVERATAILPILMTRRVQESSASSLLRPSQAAAVDHLLHPAHDTRPDPTGLLRPYDMPKTGL